MDSRFVSESRNTEFGYFLFLWYVVSKLAFGEEILFGYWVVFDKGSSEKWPCLLRVHILSISGRSYKNA